MKELLENLVKLHLHVWLYQRLFQGLHLEQPELISWHMYSKSDSNLLINHLCPDIHSSSHLAKPTSSPAVMNWACHVVLPALRAAGLGFLSCLQWRVLGSEKGKLCKLFISTYSEWSLGHGCTAWGDNWSQSAHLTWGRTPNSSLAPPAVCLASFPGISETPRAVWEPKAQIWMKLFSMCLFLGAISQRYLEQCLKFLEDCAVMATNTASTLCQQDHVNRLGTQLMPELNQKQFAFMCPSLVSAKQGQSYTCQDWAPIKLGSGQLPSWSFTDAYMHLRHLHTYKNQTKQTNKKN